MNGGRIMQGRGDLLSWEITVKILTKSLVIGLVSIFLSKGATYSLDGPTKPFEDRKL